MIFSVSSSAAARPTFGSAPAPRPFVSLLPICSLLGAALVRSACMSVLAMMNSTPSSPERTIRFTALQPPPPTPITLMRAPAALASSSSRSRSRFGSRASSSLDDARDDARIETLLVAGAPDLVPDEMEDFFSSRLQNLGQNPPRHHARLAAADARHFHRFVFLDHRRERTATLAFDLLRVRNRRPQAD